MKAEIVNLMGSDITVVNAARVSFNKHVTTFTEKDTRLIKYLSKNGHFTPFTHATITVHEKVPIFVARQRFKHTIGFSYNEVSRRYVDEPPEFYIPNSWRGRPDGSIKQGSNDTIVTSLGSEGISDLYEVHLQNCETLYNLMIKEGVAPEQARMVLPQSMYTEYWVTGSLYAFARAYKLRIDGHAQKEIQDLAKMWDEQIRPHFPVSWDALIGE